MEELLDNAPCGFLTARDDGVIETVNRTLLDLLGYAAAEDLVGRHIETILSAGGRIFYHTHVFPLLKLHKRASEIYLDLRSREGGTVPVLVNAVRREKDETEAVSTYVFIPIHQRNKFEEELLLARREAEAANRAKDEFLSVVSHELRTPLNAIIGWIRVLEAGGGDRPGVFEKALETIDRNASIQINLIEDILDYSRIISGKLRLEPKRTEIGEIVNRAVDSVTPAAEAKELTLMTELGPTPKTRVDPDRLLQVLWNLLSNAVKFTPKGGRIRVRTRLEGPDLEISVKDTGQGIDAEFLPYVFGRFEQKDKARTRRHGGLGLGLAISRHIVELHGGTIRAESEGEGRGTTFIVRLPLTGVVKDKPESAEGSGG